MSNFLTKIKSLFLISAYKVIVSFEKIINKGVVLDFLAKISSKIPIKLTTQ